MIETDKNELILYDSDSYEEKYYVKTFDNEKAKYIILNYSINRTIKNTFAYTNYFNDGCLYIVDTSLKCISIYNSQFNPYPVATFDDYILVKEKGENIKWLQIN